MPDDSPRESRVNPYQSPLSSAGRRSMRSGLLVMCASFLVLSGLGCAFIFGYWSRAGAAGVGIVRSVGFVAILAGIHFVGYRMWKRQQTASPTKLRDSDTPASVWSRNVPHGLFWLVVFALFLLLLLALRL